MGINKHTKLERRSFQDVCYDFSTSEVIQIQSSLQYRAGKAPNFNSGMRGASLYD